MTADSERDISLICIILEFCSQAEKAIEYFGKSLKEFKNNNIFRNAVSMPVMQIGEYAKRLSVEFRTNHRDIPWHQICGMRDWFAHGYCEMDIEAIWKTVVEDIPVLRKFCEDILNEQ